MTNKVETTICVLLVFIFVAATNHNNWVQSAKVSCRCGPRPWSNKDLDSQEPTFKCCEYFVESGEGQLNAQENLCKIENEFIYKRFHSCCVGQLKSAYCFTTQFKNIIGANGKERVDLPLVRSNQAKEDIWKKYENIFRSGYGRK